MATIYKRGGKGSRGARYYISYFNHRGERVSRSARTTDRAAAERIAAKLEAEAALRRDGVVDPTLDDITRQSRRTIASHLEDFTAKMHTANRTEKHIRYTRQFIEWICDFAKFETAADIHADGVYRYAQKLKKDGLASRTIQSHLHAIKAFTKWLAENQKLPRDPLVGVKTPSPASDRRLERRILLPEEWPWLRDVTLEGPARYGVAGIDRYRLYATAIQTGLRSNELRQLRRGDCHLDVSPAYLTARAGTTKNGKEARQYVDEIVAEELRRHLGVYTRQGKLFKMPHETNLARALRDDVAAARSRWLHETKEDEGELQRRNRSDFLASVNDRGEVLDFHSLRHTCGAWLALAGEHPKVIQSVMRHSSIALTMDTYGHLFPGQQADAVNRFSKIMTVAN
jgi:integrase